MGVLDGKKKEDGSGEGGGLTLEAVMAKVNEVLDVKVSAKFDDFAKTKLPDQIKAQIQPVNDQLTTMNESLAKLVGGQGQGGQGGGQGGDGKGISPEVNQTIKTMQDRLKLQDEKITGLQTAKEEAEKRAEQTDRHSNIRTVLTGLNFVNEQAARTAFGIIEPHVRRLDDGSLVAGIDGDNFPVDAFTKDYLQKEHSYLFKPTGSSGSGVPQSGGGIRMGAKADTNMIKSGMKPAEREAVVAGIQNALASVGVES
jgi:hypothetical protein